MKTTQSRTSIGFLLLSLWLTSPMFGQISDPLVFEGGAIYEQLGYSVASAGDVNGDSFDDIIIGSVHSSEDPVQVPGKAFIHFGGGAMDNIPDVTLYGNFPNDQFGFCVDGAGDLNNDGYDDVLVSAPDQYWSTGQTYIGRVYVFFGGETMDPVPDLILEGSAPHGAYGFSVAGIGDVNGDSTDDIMVGSPATGTGMRGHVEIHFGGASLDNIPDIVIEGSTEPGMFGFSVDGAGDLNLDGYNDIIVGQILSDGGIGRTYVFFGGAPMDIVPDLMLSGEYGGDNFGCSVAGLGDVNSDGFMDLGVGAIYNDVAGWDAGRAYIFLGSAATDNIADLVLQGYDFSRFGHSVAGLGDINDDGYDDVGVGAYWYPYPHGWAQGRVDIFLGSPCMDNVPDTSFYGTRGGYNYFGWPVASAGDVNNDGHPDVIIGEWAYCGLNYLGGRGYLYTHIYPNNTVVGNNVSVKPTDPATGTAPVTVTFETVSQSGHTSLGIVSQGPRPPLGFSLGNSPKYYEVASQSSHSGQISVAIQYAPQAFRNENQIRIVHQEQGSWVDRTTQNNPSQRQVTATVSSLSLFILAEPDPAPPSISVSLNPSLLWPPNNSLSDIRAVVNATDDFPGVSYALTSITCNEPSSGDIQDAGYGTADLIFKLRATRLGKGVGRVYTVTYTATDVAGNTASASAAVVVPHDKGKNTVISAGPFVPNEFALAQNYPNPFNPVTSINYQLPVNTHVSLKIFDLLGNEIGTLVDGMREAGYKTVEFDASNLTSGVYYYRLKAGDFVQTKKLLLLR